ncbi:MAG: sigma-70 family RNA polymerase sigma factor [Planctomycetota bacterium]
MTPDDPHDSELLAGIARQDLASLERLYQRHAPMLLGLARRILGDLREAEDCLQDVLIELWEKSDRFSASRGSVRSYLLLLTRSRCLDRLRKRRLRTVPELFEPADPAQTEPLAGAQHDELRSAVGDALDTLPDAQRRSLELAFFDGLTHAEIAEKTETPLGTIKGHIRRSLQRIADALQGHASEPASAGRTSSNDERRPS